ncbi:hypothetical protein FI206_02630 [Salmonella enterica subsp. enterica]|nr:hypothetical protein [Salmonella enterica subsp. enterica serovar Hessarek]
MSSLDFLNNIINPAREAAGENPIRYRDFLRRVIDELEELPASESFVRYGNTVTFYTLNYDQMMLVGMRESKAVRKVVLARIKELEAKTGTHKTVDDYFEDIVQAYRANPLRLMQAAQAFAFGSSIQKR